MCAVLHPTAQPRRRYRVYTGVTIAPPYVASGAVGRTRSASCDAAVRPVSHPSLSYARIPTPFRLDPRRGHDPRRRGRRRPRTRAGLHRADHLLRGAHRAAVGQGAPGRPEDPAVDGRARAAHRHVLAERRTVGEQRHGAEGRPHQPGELRLGSVRRGDRRRAPAALAGAAGCVGAGAQMGDLDTQGPRHAARPAPVPAADDRRGQGVLLGGLSCSRSGTSPTTRSSSCRSGTPTRPPRRRASTARCGSTAMPG